MTSEEDLRTGLRGWINFPNGPAEYEAEGAILQYDEVEGVTLKWTGAVPSDDPLPFVYGSFTIGEVTIPDLRSKHRLGDPNGYHLDYQAKEFYSAYPTNTNPYHIEVASAAIPVSYLQEYLHRAFFTWEQPEPGVTRYTARNVRIPLGFVEGLNADCALIIEALTNSDRVKGATIIPQPGVLVQFEKPLPAHQCVQVVAPVRSFLEFVMCRPNREAYLELHAPNGSRVRYRHTLRSAHAAAAQETLLELPIRLCEDHLSQMLKSWLMALHKSRAVDHLMRLMYYPDLPQDTRFFMAFAALGLMNDELTGADPKKKKREIEHLKACRELWQALLPDVQPAEMESYWKRLVNTRNDIAHLSRSTAEVLAPGPDLARGTAQLVCLARARSFKHLGLPQERVVPYLNAVRAELERMHGPLVIRTT